MIFVVWIILFIILDFVEFFVEYESIVIFGVFLIKVLKFFVDEIVILVSFFVVGFGFKFVLVYIKILFLLYL